MSRIWMPESPAPGNLLLVPAADQLRAGQSPLTTLLGGLLTTRGDILRRGAANAERLALGAVGTGPVSDGTDLVYGYRLPGRLLESVAVTSGSSYTFATTLEAGKSYTLKILQWRQSSNGDLLLRVRIGGSISTGGSDYAHAVFIHASTNAFDFSNGRSSIILMRSVLATNGFGAGTFDFGQLSGQWNIQGQSSFLETGNNQHGNVVTGRRLSSSTVDGLQLLPSAGNIAHLYAELWEVTT